MPLFLKKPEPYAPVILRIGLAFLFLWFGFSQLLNTASWISWVPAWAPALSHLGVDDIVMLNGSFEIIAGAFLAIGIWVRWAALLLGLHLLVIVGDIGLSAIGVRDLALSLSTFALSAFGSDRWTLDYVIDAE